MRKIAAVSLLCLAGFCAFSFMVTKEGCGQDSGRIRLKDTSLSTTLSCRKKDGKWVVSNEDAAARYLGLVAAKSFKLDNTSFRDIRVSFDAASGSGVLEGVGDHKGQKVPVGINFKRAPGSGNAMLVREKHSCKSVSCGACVFIKKGGVILGCGCDQGQDIGMCNHTVTNK